MKRKKMTKKDLTSGMIEHLIYGSRLLDWEQDTFKTDDDRRDTWEKHRDYILLNYCDRVPSDHDGTFQELTFQSGSRPAAWWSYSNECGKRNDQESQFEFLKRNDLLFSDEEIKYLKNQEAEKAKRLRLKLFTRKDEKPDLKVL